MVQRAPAPVLWVLALGLWCCTIVHANGLEPVAPEAVGLSSERLQRIEATLSRDIEAGELPGAVVMIARRGGLAYAKALGNLDPARDAPMAEEAIFRIYSMTKPLVSVAAMILVEEGAMLLTDPVAKHLPAFAEPQIARPVLGDYARVSYDLTPAGNAMTVQDLLRHTAGLVYGEINRAEPVRTALAEAQLFQVDDMPFETRKPSPEAFVAGLAKVPLVHEPGTTWEYSLASDLLGRVVEQVAGMGLEAFLHRRLFEPLGMKDSGFHVPEEDLQRLAEPFAPDPAKGIPPLFDVANPPGNASGGAGAVATAMDYLRFSQMLLNGGALDGVRILSPTTVQLMTADHLGGAIEQMTGPGPLLLGTPGYGFGLGFMVRLADGIAGVPGSKGEFMWGGFGGTFFWVDPDEELAAVFMSQSVPNRAHYRRLIKQLAYQAIVD
ncbi:MAG: serine hydrolase domain-containing protein [Candidatus Competibacterales bacterium]